MGFSVALLVPALRAGTYTAADQPSVAAAWARRDRATTPDIEWDASARDAGPASFVVNVTSIAETSHSSERRGSITVDVTDFRVHGTHRRNASLHAQRPVAPAELPSRDPSRGILDRRARFCANARRPKKIHRKTGRQEGVDFLSFPSSRLPAFLCFLSVAGGTSPVEMGRSTGAHGGTATRAYAVSMPDPLPVVLALPLALFALMWLLRSVRQVEQWEVALRFTLGKLSGRLEPGLQLVFPGIQKMVRIDTRIRNRDLPYQQVITQDNVTASIDAVIYYKVVDPEKAILNVENYETAVWDRAKVVLRDVAGETRLDELLTHREQIAAKVRAAVEQFVAQWGLHIELIALKDIQLPTQMQEVIARKAIAERDRQYVIIKSQADVESAKNFADAARILAGSPGAMELRRLEALQNLSAQGTSKVIFDLAKPYGDVHGAAGIAAAMADGESSDAKKMRVAKGELAPEVPGEPQRSTAYK